VTRIVKSAQRPGLLPILGVIFALGLTSVLRAAHDVIPESSPAPASSDSNRLELENDSTLVWKSQDGLRVEVKGPELTLEDPKDKAKLPFKIELKEHSIRHGEATLQYALSLNEREFHLVGTATLEASPSGNSKEDVLIERIEFSFPEAIKANIEAVEPFDLRGDAPRQIGLPELNGVFRTWPMTSGAGGAGRFELGRAAQGPVQCSVLAMPVVGLILDDPGTSTQSYPDSAHELAVAADPYWGSFIQAQAAKENGLASTSITVRSTYTGAIIPVRSERRTLALEFHRKGTDGTLRTFYRTIPEIEPAASWTQGVQLV
jgi:hypothetical protein